MAVTEARPGGGPKFIHVNTEARSEIRQKASAAPDERKSTFRFGHATQTDARRKSCIRRRIPDRFPIRQTAQVSSCARKRSNPCRTHRPITPGG